MKPITKNGTFPALLALGLLLMALAGCSAATGNPNAAQENSEDKPSSPYTGNLVGKVEGTNAFVAVVVDRENHALAYICDGNEIAEWFRGAVAQDGSLDLRSEGGALLVAEVAKSGTEGTVTLEGEEHAFSASRAEEPAGL